MPRHLFCKAAFLSLLLAGSGIAADDPTNAAQARAKLEGLRARITGLTTEVAGELARRDSLAADLRAADLTIPEKRRALEAVEREQEQVRKRGAQLAAERTRTQQRMDAQRAELARQVRASYTLGRESQLKLMLNQENPAMVGRMLTYHGYFSRALVAQIRVIETEVAHLQDLERDIGEQSATLRRLGETARERLQALVQARAQRAGALSALNRRVETANQQIERMKRERSALDSLLADLGRLTPDYALGPKKPFEQMRGSLPWPVAGRVAAGFHTARGAATNAAVRWNGLLINAAPAAKVRAPYFGRVIYADWLQGMGLLLIIEHGGGYLSLFSRAEVLYKRVGDSVAPGDVIAALGQGDAPQLYFEIRRGTTALDPKLWLKSAR